MARRYSRDNRGRFASAGTGATARGGRLRTAAGNKRATVTAKVAGGNPAGTMKGKVKRDAGAAGKAGQGKASAPKTPSNKIAASPRQLSKNEQIARDVMTNKSFRSDRQRIAEMQRRGIDRNTDFVGLVANVRAKQGGGTTAKIKPASKPPSAPTAAPKPAAAPKPKRRVFIRGNFRPQNVMANPAPDKTKYYKNQKGKNIAELEAIAKKAGANTQVVTKRKQNLAVAMAFKPMNLVRLNKASDFYANPRQAMRAQRRMGQLSTTDPRGVAFHELGHLRQKKKSENIFTQREFSSPRNARLAGRVSQYAKTNANEFAAETYAGLKTGRRYDSQVMRAYRQEMGLRPLSIRRQLKRKPNP